MKRRHLDLREKHNKYCLRGCTTDDRRHMTDDGLCKNVMSVLDGLPVRCVGEWGYDKVYRLTQYFGVFASGMKNKWTGLNYLEIGSGPGRCILRETGEELDGTSLAVINRDAFSFIRKAIFVDKNEDVVTSLNDRISSLGKSGIAEATTGDYTDLTRMGHVLSELPDRCLNLVFLDPTDCSIPFSLIRLIDKSLVNVDVIANIALKTDVGRNIRSAILDPAFKQVRQKYSSFLGGEDFFRKAEVNESAKSGKDAKLRELFLDEYRVNLGALGFIYTDTVPVKNYYHLFYASKDSRGLDFWQKACGIGPNGQRNLFKSLN